MPGHLQPMSRRIISPRTLLAFVPAAALLVLARPVATHLALGLPLVLAGEALRIWACGYLQKNVVLTTAGPYRFVKNPLYVGTFLILSGLLWAAWSPRPPANRLGWLLPLFLGAFFLFYLPRKQRLEGERLRRRFGRSYDDYAAAVPAFIPRLTPYRARVRDDPSWSAALVARNSELETAAVVLLVSAWLVVRSVSAP
jgi:protein-S-isoprenylcysteine O-methyltransferase Ste14